MLLELESGLAINAPVEADLARIEGEGFAILSKEDYTYIQSAQDRETPGKYILEYQVGALHKHYCAADGPFSFDQIRSAFHKYLRGDDSWMTDFQWEPMDLS